MKSSIIAVGTELLFGQTVNTNAAFISENLNLLGFDVMYHYVVGDNPNRLMRKIDEALELTDLCIITGGLGPTQDDLTKETVAQWAGVDLYEDVSVTQDLKDYFAIRNREMSPNNLKQAMLPVGCIPFYNSSGTAPGFALKINDKIIVCLPGPPREMKHLWSTHVKQFLEGYIHGFIYYRVIRTIGIGESDLEMKLMPLIDNQTDPTIATYAKEGECTIRVASKRTTLTSAKSAVEDCIKKIDDIIGDNIYSYDDEELNEVVVKLLKNKGLTLSSSESATGGMFASSITDVSGASNVFDTSYVTYSNKSKINNLGVKPETIEQFSVSSPEVAVEMAEGTLKNTGSNIAVSITGNAGPDVYEGQHAGLAFIGWAYKDKSGYIVVDTNRNDRKWNRNFFKLSMLRTVYSILNGNL